MKDESVLDYLYRAFTYKQVYTIYGLLYDWGRFNAIGDNKYDYVPGDPSIYYWLEKIIVRFIPMRITSTEDRVIDILSQLLKVAVNEVNKK